MNPEASPFPKGGSAEGGDAKISYTKSAGVASQVEGRVGVVPSYALK